MALAVPNFSEGRDHDAIAAISSGFGGAELLDRHSDEVHNRTVLTLTAPASKLWRALIGGARACTKRIDISAHQGAHPCIGALDVCPIVWLEPEGRGAARDLALAVAAELGGIGLPVFLYGELATAPERTERAYFRRGGFAELAERMGSGELAPDFGPKAPHPRAGATLVTARPPLAAFNVELDTGDFEVADAIASALRESGGGLPGVRAIAIDLGDRAQVSTNVHDPLAVPLAAVVERVRELAADRGAAPVAAEIVGLVPRAALAGYPEDVPIRGVDPDAVTLEGRIASAEGQPPT